MPGLPPRPPGGAGPTTVRTPLAQRTEGVRRAKHRAEPHLPEELLLELQFAHVAEMLRRVCFAYGNRFVEVAHDSDDSDDDGGGGEAAEQRTLMHQLPDTDAEPHDAARISPSVLVAFAEDMMITPHLLLREETAQAVVDTLDRRRRRAHLPASMDKTLCDFLAVCANKVMAKRPYCNVYGSATTRQKVRALVDFVSLDCEGITGHALSSRFSVPALPSRRVPQRGGAHPQQVHASKFTDAVPGPRAGLPCATVRAFFPTLPGPDTRSCDRPSTKSRRCKLQYRQVSTLRSLSPRQHTAEPFARLRGREGGRGA
jgi:hypothetical protein